MRLQVAPCGYFAIDDERYVTFVNDEALRLLGYEEQELLGRSVAQLLPPASRILFHTHLYPTVAEGRRVEELYILLRRKTGEDVPVLLAASRAVHEGRALTECAFLAVRRRSLFERHLQQLDALRDSPPAAPSNDAAGRMFMLGFLVAGVAHEVRNPLSFVLGNLQLLQEELDEQQAVAPDREALREYVTDARNGAERILELVKAVGVVSHADNAAPQAVDVARVVATAARLVRYRITQGATLEVDGPEPGPVVMADEGRLAQVLMNLLVNAGQALTTSPPPKPAIRVKYGQAEHSAVIEVSDNGPGVPEASREQIFRPFYTTKPIGEGTGLGLALAREIVESLQGTMELAPSTGAGATFRVSLPLRT